MNLLAFTGDDMTAEAAQRVGLVTELADDPLARAMALATTIASRSPAAVMAAKKLVRDGVFNRSEELYNDGLQLEETLQQRLIAQVAAERAPK